MRKASFGLLAPFLLAALSCADPIIEVEGARPVPRDIESALTTNGRIEATSRVAIHAAVAGRVERLFVRQGDRVEGGQEMLRLRDTGQAESLAQARARLDAAKARLALLDAGLAPASRAALQADRAKLVAARKAASSDLERLERLVRQDAAPRVELEGKRRLLHDQALEIEAIDVQLASPLVDGQREEVEAAIDEARSVVAEAQRVVAKLRVGAPSSGVVYSLPVFEGDYLHEGALAARVGVLDAVRARIFVDEPDLGRVEKGSLASIRADAYPGREWTCEVDRLASEVVEMGARRVGEVHCTVKNPDGRLLPNLAVGVRIVTERVRAAPSIPRLSVVRGDGRTFVWTVKDGRASRREILSGVEGPVYVEVRGGLDESEIVLLPSEDPVSEGRRVKALLPEGGGDG